MDAVVSVSFEALIDLKEVLKPSVPVTFAELNSHVTWTKSEGVYLNENSGERCFAGEIEAVSS